VQLIKKLPKEGAVEKLQEISCHSFKNVDNIKGEEVATAAKHWG